MSKGSLSIENNPEKATQALRSAIVPGPRSLIEVYFNSMNNVKGKKRATNKPFVVFTFLRTLKDMVDFYVGEQAIYEKAKPSSGVLSGEALDGFCKGHEQRFEKRYGYWHREPGKGSVRISGEFGNALKGELKDLAPYFRA